MKVIGLTGKARSGKDTVAGIIADELHELNVARHGFADKLKVSAARALGIEANSDAGLIEAMDWLKVNGSVIARCEWGPYDVMEARLSGREFLQRYGTEAHRDTFSDTFWVDALLPSTFAKWPQDPPGLEGVDVLVVPDVRFENEALRISEYGGEVWQVWRPDVAAVEAHSSEDPLPRDLIDRVVLNSGTLDGLRYVVRETLLAGAAE